MTMEFNPNNWKSIKAAYNKVEKSQTMLFGENENGEDVIFDIFCENALKVDTLQSNGWTRTNIYWLDDKTVEELYKRD